MASFKEGHPAVNVCRVKATIPRGGSLLKKQRAEHRRLVPCLAFGCSLVLLFAYLTSFAQTVSPITSSGLNTRVSPPVSLPSGQTQYNITGGTRPGGASGTNLFHSLGDFNVPTKNIANFLNDSGLTTSNILGRVTGGNLSNIFGTIQTTGFGNANLFLMNPAGFLFGANATINVGGMVSFTSADYLRLTDNARFNAVAGPGDALLTAAPVAAFGFLGSNPGAITIQGSQLTVTEGTGISLVGGNITIHSGTLDNGTVQPARLAAPGGQINLASVVSPGELSAVTFAPLSTITMGDISLSQGASLESSADTAGRISIRGGQLIMDDASIKAVSMNGSGGDASNNSPTISLTAETIALKNGVLITADSNGTAAAGDITLNVDTLTTQAGANRLPLNPTNNFNFAGNFIAADSRSTDPAAGSAGTIIIQGVGGPGTAAKSVVLKDSTISSRVFGGTPETAPSSITITADSVLLSNEGLPAGGRAATIVANTLGSAPGGHVAFNVNTLLSNVNLDETPIPGTKTVFVISNNDTGVGAGPTGTNTISGIRPESTDAAKLVALSDTHISTGADGGNPATAPGNITITTDTLSLGNGTRIYTTNFGETGTPAGNITLNVNTLRANTMPDGTLITTVPLVSPDGALTTGEPIVFIGSVAVSGKGGNITISGIKPETTDAAQQLALNNIELNTVAFSGTAQTAPATLTVTADTVHLTHSKNIKTDTQGAAPAGNILFTVNTLLADDASSISSSTSGPGPGGNISINAAQSVTLSSGSSISASSIGPGNAGNILIRANEIHIDGGGRIAASSTGSGAAGNVTIEGLASPAQSVVINGAPSGIFTDTSDSGSGGNILVNSNMVTLQNGGTISASTSGPSSSATGGSISIFGGQFVQLNNGASITASSTGPGNAGNIFIDAGPQLTMQSSSIKTEAAQAGGGNIDIRASDLVQLGNSMVSTSVLGGIGSGGNITIDPNIVLLQNSQILAQAVQGVGGNISITTNLLLPDTASIISASSQFGQQGTISIQSPISPASGKIIPLSQKPLIETSLMSQRCAALAGGNASSFTVAGRDALPTEPGGWLSTPLALTTGELVGSTATEPDMRTSLSGSTEEMPVVSLRRIAPPGFLTQSFAADWTTGCIS